MLKKFIESNMKTLLKCKKKFIVEENGKNWRVKFWIKTQTKWRCHQNREKLPLKCKRGPRNWDRRLEIENKKSCKKSGRMWVKLLKSEKELKVQRNFKGEKKWSASKKCFESTKTSQLKKAVKVENNHRIFEERRGNNCRKSWQKPQTLKKCKVEKIGEK